MFDHEEEQDKMSHRYTFLKYCYNLTSFLDFEWVQTIFIVCTRAKIMQGVMTNLS